MDQDIEINASIVDFDFEAKHANLENTFRKLKVISTLILITRLKLLFIIIHISVSYKMLLINFFEPRP